MITPPDQRDHRNSPPRAGSGRQDLLKFSRCAADERLSLALLDWLRMNKQVVVLEKRGVASIRWRGRCATLVILTQDL